MDRKDPAWDPAMDRGGLWGHRLLGWQPTGSCWEIAFWGKQIIESVWPLVLLPAGRMSNRGKWAGYTAEAWDLSALLSPAEGCDRVQDRCLAEEEPFSTDELAASLLCNQSGSLPTVTLKPLEAFSHLPDHSYMLWPGSKTLDSNPSSTVN